jgi:hypothetical protein
MVVISTREGRDELTGYLDVLGGYLADCQLAPAAEFATDPKIAERLWGLSEELVGEKFDLGGK